MKNKRLKVFLAIISIGLIVTTGLFVYRENKIIGEISGPEFDRLTIGETKYTLTNKTGYPSVEKGKYLGKANYRESTVRLYTVKNDQENKYIYATWDWEGMVYVRE